MLNCKHFLISWLLLQKNVLIFQFVKQVQKLCSGIATAPQDFPGNILRNRIDRKTGEANPIDL